VIVQIPAEATGQSPGGYQRPNPQMGMDAQRWFSHMRKGNRSGYLEEGKVKGREEEEAAARSIFL
jgi:hypothetical protein